MLGVMDVFYDVFNRLCISAFSLSLSAKPFAAETRYSSTSS